MFGNSPPEDHCSRGVINITRDLKYTLSGCVAGLKAFVFHVLLKLVIPRRGETERWPTLGRNYQISVLLPLTVNYYATFFMYILSDDLTGISSYQTGPPLWFRAGQFLFIDLL